MNASGKTTCVYLSLLLICIIGAKCHNSNPVIETREFSSSKQGPVQILNILNPPSSLDLTSASSPETQAAPCNCHKEVWYIIRHGSSDLVLDGSLPDKVTVDMMQDKDEQLWKFVPADRIGEYFIVNKKTSLVLDVIRESRTVITSEKKGTLNQHWVIDSGDHFYNVGMKEKLDLTDNKPGSSLETYFKMRDFSQIFHLEKKEETDE